MSVEGCAKELGIADEQRTQRFKPIFENNLIVGSERVPSYQMASARNI